VRKAKLFFTYVCYISLLLLWIEMASFFVAIFLQRENVFYTPAIYNSYEDYLSIRDEVLGWPSPDGLAKSDEHDSTGSRIIPAFLDSTESQNCISLYGDSHTWSDGVDNRHAWSNILSILVGCRVANYGVGGYGSDQAFLRFRMKTDDSSKIVFLNHLSENILRNVNQFRDLLYNGEGIGFKPRFIIDEKGSLTLIPLPTFSTEQYKDVVLRPAQYFSNEYFLPNGLSGASIASFPYTFSVLRALNHFHVKAKFLGEPWYHDFYKKDHPSMGLEVTTKILASFHDEAIERGKVPVITIIPTGIDVLYLLEHGVWPYQSLIDELSLYGISIFNFGEGIMSHVDNRDPCSLFRSCSGHLNQEGYEILASVAYGFLLKRQLLEKIGIQKKRNEAN